MTSNVLLCILMLLAFGWAFWIIARRDGLSDVPTEQEEKDGFK